MRFLVSRGGETTIGTQVKIVRAVFRGMDRQNCVAVMLKRARSSY